MFERLKAYFNKSLPGISVILGCNDSSTEDYIHDPYSNISFCLAMQKRTEATKIIQVGIFTGYDKDKKELEKHKLDPLLYKVNPNLSYGDFIDYVLNWSIAKDNGVLIEKVVGLPSMAPDLVVYNPDNFRMYFDSSELARIEIINPHRIITGKELKNFKWIKSCNYYTEVAGYDPYKQSTGLSNQRAMSILGSYIKKVWNWNWSLAKNSGRVNGIISADGDYSLTQEDREEIRDKYSSMASGLNNGKPIVMGTKIRYQDTSKSPTDVDWSNGELTAHQKICLSVGVPPELVGAGESTYNNRLEAKKELYTDTIIPWYQDFIRQLNDLLKKELGNAYFDIKIGSIEALKENKAEELQALETAKDRLTINEYRKEYARIMGIELNELENGNVIVIGGETLDNISTDIKGDGSEKEDDI